MNYDQLDLSILKSLITNKKYALEFASECDTKLFSSDLWNFSNLLTTYIKNFKETPTLRVLTENLEKNKNTKVIDYVKTIWSELDKLDYDTKEYKHDLTKFKARYADKELSKLAAKLSKAKENGEKIDVQNCVAEIQKTIFNIKSLEKTQIYERKTLKETVDIFRDEFNNKLNDPSYGRGITTGYSFLDNATDGLRPGELILIGGESGSGKSMLLMNMALQIWMQDNKLDQTENFTKGHNIVYFSLEMPVGPCRNRMYARLAGIPSKIIRNPVSKDGKLKLDSDQRAKLKKALQFIKNYPYELEIVDIPRNATAEQIDILFEEAKLKFNPDVIIVDYLGIMDDESDAEDWLKLSEISSKLHVIARVHNVPVISAVQLNRIKAGKNTEESERIGLHRIGRSALIITHANIALQILSRPNEQKYPTMEVFVIKNRDGEHTKGKLLKNLACGSLLDNPDQIEDNVEVEFSDYISQDDLSKQIELLDI